MTSTGPSLFDPFDRDPLQLAHRIVLAPMTRARADAATLAPTSITEEYYRQRASVGGLLISEAVHISPEGMPVWTIYDAVREHGGHATGLWTEAQTLGWRRVTHAVHDRGSRISCQLLHAGRVAQPGIGEHPLVRDGGLPLPSVSSSAIALVADETGGDYSWDRPAAIPRALGTDEISRVIGDYQTAARNALRAGFDYVELHAAHGYLLEQFMHDGVNQRTDRYGGSIANRCRFLFELVAALLDVGGAGRLGVRLSPTAVDPATGKAHQTYFGVHSSDPVALYRHAVEGLNHCPLAYLLLTEPRVGGLSVAPEDDRSHAHPLRNTLYRELYRGCLIGAGGFTPRSAAEAVASGAYDLIAFGRWFLANPDLPERLRQQRTLNVYDRRTFYGGGAEGYIDYPEWTDAPERTPPRYDLIDPAAIGTSRRPPRG